jgi:hypothetical protein
MYFKVEMHYLAHSRLVDKSRSANGVKPAFLVVQCTQNQFRNQRGQRSRDMGNNPRDDAFAPDYSLDLAPSYTTSINNHL